MSVKILDIQKKPKGWDIYDGVAEGIDPVQFIEDCPLLSEVVKTHSKKVDIPEAILSDIEDLTGNEYEFKRKEIAKKYKVRALVLDAWFLQLHPQKKESESSNGIPILFDNHEPFNQPVDGAALLDEISTTIKRFLILPDEAADTMALYVIFTYIFQDFGIAALLCFISAIKRCAKTRAEIIMSFLCCRPLAVSNISEAALFRTITKYEPTLILDELDAVFKQKSDKAEALRGLLNSGQTKATAFTLRCDPVTFDPVLFSTFGPKIGAAIKGLPETIMDRSFVIHLERKKPSEKVDRLSIVNPDPIFKILRSKIQKWVNDNREQIKNIEPALQPELTDRETDNWGPLLAIAETAGEKWVKRATRAALFLSSENTEEGEVAVMLLEDIYNYFDGRETDRVSSVDLAAWLGEMEHRPWPEWKKEKSITPRQIAQILKPFRIGPSKFRINEIQIKGYRKENFLDPWDRYIIGTTVPEEDNSLTHKDLPCSPSGTGTDPKGTSGTDPKSTSTTTVPHGKQSKSLQQKELEQTEKERYRGTDKNPPSGRIKL
ncbi:MAG: DUF3631 domain-containing protein [Planctomycetes bacterium]|nr:DUF3631 domain-containing protein [Planctomycetota bacterium]